jgi:hypothetical protein
MWAGPPAATEASAAQPSHHPAQALGKEVVDPLN